MARIINPATAAGWKKRHDDIRKKHDADGAGSALNNFLQEETMDLAADNSALAEALTHHNNHIAAANKSEEHSAERKKLFKLPFSNLKKSVQYLKALFISNPRKLSDWGLQVDNENKIIYPPDFVSRYKLFTGFYAKHKTYPAGQSPLENFLLENEIDLAQMKTDADKANTAHDNFGVEDKKSEEERLARDNTMKQPLRNTTAIQQFLKKHFANNPKKLGQYGIIVDDSPRGVVRRKSKLPPGGQKTITAAHIGGFFTNTGMTLLKLFAGKKANGNGITVEAGKEWIILKGYSNMVALNTNMDNAGSFSVNINR